MSSTSTRRSSRIASMKRIKESSNSNKKWFQDYDSDLDSWQEEMGEQHTRNMIMFQETKDVIKRLTRKNSKLRTNVKEVEAKLKDAVTAKEVVQLAGEELEKVDSKLTIKEVKSETVWEPCTSHTLDVDDYRPMSSDLEQQLIASQETVKGLKEELKKAELNLKEEEHNANKKLLLAMSKQVQESEFWKKKFELQEEQIEHLRKSSTCYILYNL